MVRDESKPGKLKDSPFPLADGLPVVRSVTFCSWFGLTPVRFYGGGFVSYLYLCYEFITKIS